MDSLRARVPPDDHGVPHSLHAFKEDGAHRTEARQKYQAHAVQAVDQPHARRPPPAARSQRDVCHDAQGKIFTNYYIVGNCHQS